MASKKDKKDRKHKSEKRTKKEKKSSKKGTNRQESRSSKKSDGAKESELASVLNKALLGDPKLMVDIPAIVKSLDDGEYVDVFSITNLQTRTMLSELMKQLPVLHDPANGFYKDSINTNVSNRILQELSSQEIIKAPNMLSMSEALASKNVVFKILELIGKFPDLRGEIGGLFSTIVDGNCVQLDSLENEDIRDGLEDLFKAIGMENSRDGFTLPDGRRSLLVKEALEHLINSFDSYSNAISSQQQKEAGTNTADIGRRRGEQNSNDGRSVNSGSSSSNAGNSSSSEDDSQSDIEEPHELALRAADVAGPSEGPSAAAGPVKGPSMPTMSDLRAARALIDQQRRDGLHQSGDYQDSSEDDDFGPQLCDARTAKVLQVQMSAVPLGFTGVEIDPSFERAFEAENAGINSRLRGEIYTGETHKVEDETKREEWILNPGDSKLAGSLSGAGLTNRKFQAGKGAKKAAEQMSIQREFQRQQQALQAAQAEAQQGTAASGSRAGGVISTDAVMKDYQEKRGESLMEQHLAKKARTTAQDAHLNVDANGKPIRRAFDRERDLLSHSKMNEDKVSKLVQNAKELDDRFDKGSIQKSFL